MPGTYATDPTFESPTLGVGNAVSSVAKDIRLYSTANTYGATLGAPTPLQGSVWGVGTLVGGGVYAIECTATGQGTNALPLTLEKAQAVKIQFKSRARGLEFTSRVRLMNPRTGAVINVGVDQSGLVGCGSVSFNSGTVPFAFGQWVELQVNLLPNGKVSVSASKWLDGQAPGTHAAAQTITGTSTSAVIDIIDDGFLICIDDRATSLEKYRYWIGTPDAPATGLAGIQALADAGWRWNGDPDGSMFPITVKSATTETWQRSSVVKRGGTHVGIVLFGFYGNSDTPISGGYTTSVRVRKNGGSWNVVNAAAVVPAGDVLIATYELAHVAGDTIEWNGTQSAGSQLPVMDAGGFYPYAADALSNSPGICVGMISLVDSGDGLKSVHCLTDSMGVLTAAESAYEAGCAVFNASVGGCKIAHVIAGDGGLKRYLLPFGDITMVNLAANDMNVDLATTAQLLERESWLMKMPGIAGKPVIRWYVAPCATPTHVALGSVWSAVATQPRLQNSLAGPAYGFSKTIGRDLDGLFIDGSSVVIEEGSMRVWKAGVTSDGIHVSSTPRTALKDLARDAIIAWLPTLEESGGGVGRLINGGLIG